MKEQLSALYELQSLDMTIDLINARLRSLSGAKTIQEELEKSRRELEDAEKNLAAYEAELTDCELRLKSIDTKRADFEKRLYSGAVSNPKELSAIQKEIAMLKSQQSQLDGKTLELYDTVEEARKRAHAAREAVRQLETKLDAALQQESEEKTRLQQKLAAAVARRATLAPTITDKTLLSRYELLRKKAGGRGIAKVIDGKCEACKISLTPFVTRKVKECKEYVFCESCGRILYFDSGDE
ncbi:MAG: C4-type zinc ribbon domain-containing protein [Armatimonadota bacterium]|nr:C4-type zinc ribbon domain-containing protein [Armatimonadota bacterium]